MVSTGTELASIFPAVTADQTLASGKRRSRGDGQEEDSSGETRVEFSEPSVVETKEVKIGAERAVQASPDSREASSQTDISLPIRVAAYWHCCPQEMTVVDSEKTESLKGEYRKSGIKQVEKVDESEVVACYGQDKGYLEATTSVFVDPRQRGIVDWLSTRDDDLWQLQETPKKRTIPMQAEMSPHYSILDFEDLEIKSPSIIEIGDVEDIEINGADVIESNDIEKDASSYASAVDNDDVEMEFDAAAIMKETIDEVLNRSLTEATKDMFGRDETISRQRLCSRTVQVGRAWHCQEAHPQAGERHERRQPRQVGPDGEERAVER